MKIRPFAIVAFLAVVAAAGVSCVDEKDGSDFDQDGVPDQLEDPNDDFITQPGETDYIRADTDFDTVCDGLTDETDLGCTGCEDCDNDGKFEPCLGETDPLNDDTDNDGANDKNDGAPAGSFPADCAGGEVILAYGASLPPGKPFPVTPTRTPFPTLTPDPNFTPIVFPTLTPTIPAIVQTAAAIATPTP